MSGVGDRVLDNGLLALTTESDRVFLCAADPISFTDANSTHVGVKNGSRGSMFYPLASPPAGGRMASMAGFNDGNITSNGNANYVVVADSVNQNLLVSEPLATPKAVKVGGLFSINALDIILGKSSQPQAANLTVASPQLGPAVFAKTPVISLGITTAPPVFDLPIFVANGSGWSNIPIATVVGLFTCAFDVKPLALGINDLAALSDGPATDYPQLACIVRFNASNNIEARNGGAYAADAVVSYVANNSYHIRIVGNINTHVYSVYVTPQGSGETQIASNYAFRTEQAAVTRLTNFAINITDSGMFVVSNITFNSMTASPLIVGSPIFPVPSINGKSTLAASNFATQSPILGAQTPNQTQRMTASDFILSSPTFISPSLVLTTGQPAGLFNDQTGNFSIQFDAVPATSLEDVVIGLSRNAPVVVSDFACIVRFSTVGNIDCRNAAAYTASTTVPYSAGMSFHFRMVVRISSHTYDVYVTPQGQSEILLANNFAFRTEQATVSDLNYLGKIAVTSDAAIGNMIGPPPAQAPSTPVVSPTTLTIGHNPAANALVGQVSATNTPTYFTIASGDPGGNFTIDSSGNIRLSAVANGTQLTQAMTGRAGASAAGRPNYSSTLTVNATNPLTISADAVYRNVNFTGHVQITGGTVLFEYCKFSFQPATSNGAVMQYNAGGFCGNTQFNYCDWDSGWTTAQGTFENDGFECGSRADSSAPTLNTSSTFSFFRCSFQHYGNMLALHKWQHNPMSYVTECYCGNGAAGGSPATHVDFIENYSTDTVRIQRCFFDANSNNYTCGVHNQVFALYHSQADLSHPIQFYYNYVNSQGTNTPTRVSNADPNGAPTGLNSVYYIGNIFNDNTMWGATCDFGNLNVTFDLAYALANPTAVYWAKSNVWAANVTSPPGGYSGGQTHTPGTFVDQANFFGGTTGWTGSIAGPTAGDATVVPFEDGTFTLMVTATNGSGTSALVPVGVTIGGGAVVSIPVVSSASFSIGNAPANDTLVGHLTVSNLPVSAMTITSGNAAGYFAVYPGTQNVRTAQSPAAIPPAGSYSLTITATNSAGTSTAAVVGITVAAATGVFPSAATTGVPSGTVLTPASTYSLSTNGATYTAINFQGGIDVHGANVTLVNCLINSTDAGAQWIVRTYSTATNLTLRNCTIIGHGVGSQYQIMAVWDNGGVGVTVDACDISHIGHGVHTTGDGQVTVKNSYIHDLDCNDASHYDGVYCGAMATSLTVTGNTIDNRRNNQTSPCFVTCDFGPVNNVLIDRNLLMGGGYSVACGDRGSYVVTNARITNNAMIRGAVGYYGALGANVVTSGNYDYNTGAPV